MKSLIGYQQTELMAADSAYFRVLFLLLRLSDAAT